jgi:hypothetical protein
MVTQEGLMETMRDVLDKTGDQYFWQFNYFEGSAICMKCEKHCILTRFARINMSDGTSRFLVCTHGDEDTPGGIIEKDLAALQDYEARNNQGKLTWEQVRDFFVIVQGE